MATATMTIRLRDRDNRSVKKDLLVENSSVFSFIIVECSQSEHDLTDFALEIVEMFLTLLEIKELKRIEEADFRELHKISAVFKVEWLVESCRKWLMEKINNSDEVIDHECAYESLLFLFEECFYIYSKWNLASFMETLIFKLRFKDNSQFLSRYIRQNYDQLNSDQLKFLLHLAGTNTKVFLDLITERLKSQEYLDDSTRTLLQRLNMTLCVEQNEMLYQEMTSRFSEMRDMSKDDCMLVLRLITQTTRDAHVHTSTPSTTLEFIEEWLSLYGDCEGLEGITSFISQGRICSMYTVIEILAKVTYRNTLSTDEMGKFVETLENLMCRNTTMVHRISRHYIDMVISALKMSGGDLGENQFIRLLEMIRISEKLCSVYGNIFLVGKAVTRATSPVQSVWSVLGWKSPDKCAFRIKLPGATECHRKSHCGFICKLNKDASWYELSREAGDYAHSGVHLHEEIKAEHITWYRVMSGKTRDGSTVQVPFRWKQWWSEWLCLGRSWDSEKQCVEYDISEYLAAKY